MNATASVAGWGSGVRKRIAGRALLLVPSAPVIFALLTWNERRASDPAASATRLFALPVLPVEACVILIAFASGWRPIAAMRRLPRLAAGSLAGLLIVAFATASFAAPNRMGALLWTYILLAHVAFGFAAVWIMSHCTEDDLKRVWPSVVVGCCVYALMFAVFVSIPHGSNFDWAYVGLGVSNLRQVGFYTAVGSLAALGCALQRRGPAALAFGVASALMFALAFWTGSRGAVLATLIAVILAWPLFRWLRNGRAIAFTLLPLGAGAAASMILPIPQDTGLLGMGRIARSVVAPGWLGASSGRFTMWHDAWRAFLHRPLLGYGDGQFGEVAPQVQETYLHPHNIILQLLVQWGAVGFLLCMTLGLLLVRQCWRRSRRAGEAIAPAILVALGLLTYSLYDGTLFHTYPLMMFAFAIAFLSREHHSGTVEPLPSFTISQGEAD